MKNSALTTTASHAATAHRALKECGFSLIELMISLVIGLVLMVFVTSLFLSSQYSARLNDDNAQVQEEGHIAMHRIGNDIMQAGYGKMRTTLTTSFAGIGFKACQTGFELPLTADFKCDKNAEQPGFIVSYMLEPNQISDDYYSNRVDCNGNTYNYGLGRPPPVVINRYFTKKIGNKTSLFCEGNGISSASNPKLNPLLHNVDKLMLTYGVDTKGNYTPSTFLDKADDVERLPLSSANKTNWDQVINVKICVELHSDNFVAAGTPQIYEKCDGTMRVAATDKKLHTTLTRTFTLRNRALPTWENL